MASVGAVIGFAGVAAAALFAGGALQQSPAPRAGPPLNPRFAGVNLASGSFGTKALPGVYGHDYIYPGPRDAIPFLAAGMNAVRLPFRWERIQPELGQPLNKAELKRLDAMVGAVAGFELIILDVHNYANYNHQKLGSEAVPVAAYADLWTRLAEHYRGNGRVAFGIMNEPTGVDAMAWRGMVDAALAAIRGTGSRNLVLVPGVRWTGAHSWTKGTPSNADALAGLKDPAGNMAFEMHQYVDGNSSGLGTTCVAPAAAAQRLAAATNWLRREHARGFLGEFGAPPTSECLAALDALLAAIDTANDVWLGWTYWAAGPRWNNYPMSIQPDRAGTKPQLNVLISHLPSQKHR